MTRTIACLLALAVSAPAYAQTNPTVPTDAPEGEITVTATRSGGSVPVDLTGASVTVLTGADLAARQTRVVSDVLRDVPGVAVSRAGGVGGFTQLRLRGGEANHTLVLIDGIEASDPFYGEFDFGTLIADEAAKIEVVRGQQSALYGSDAIGGVVNYITLTGAEAPGTTIRAEGGSLGTLQAGARTAGVAGDLDYALTASWYHTDGYPVAVGGQRDVGSSSVTAGGKATWTAAPNLRVTAVGRFGRTRADTDNTDSDFASPTYGRVIDTPGVGYRNTAFYGLLRGQLDLLDGRFTNVASGQVADTRRASFDVADPFAPAAGQPIVQAGGDHGRRLKGSYEGSFRFGGEVVKQQITAAVDHENERARTTVSQFGAFLGWRHTDNTGLVGEYQLTALDRFGLGGSVRRDWNSRFADTTTWRAQASARIGAGTRLHAAGGSGVKAPTFAEQFDFYAGRYIGNPGLRPERSTGWEAGVEQAFLDRRLVVNATWFDNRLRNEIAVVYDADFVGTSVNLPGRTRQRGLEASAAVRAGDWRLDASYTYTRARRAVEVTTDPLTFATATVSAQAVRRARDIASATIGYAPATRPYAATVTVRYNGAQNDLFYGTFPPTLVRLGDYVLVNLAASWRIDGHVELFGRIENLAGQRYQELFSYATAGRAAYGGLRLRL